MNASRHENAPRPSIAASVQAAQLQPGQQAPSGETLVSRRRFLYGAIGAGALAAVGIGAAAIGAESGGSDSDVDYLDVPESALITLNDMEALDGPDDQIQLIGDFDIPYGTLVWANDDEVAACLLPTETGSPLAQIGLLYLGSGLCDTVLERAIGTASGYEIYDVRATAYGVIWTEANILQGVWRIYAAPLSEGVMGDTVLLDEGDDRFDTPTLAVSGKRAFWQVVPKPDFSTDHPSRLMGATFGRDEKTCVFESERRMCTPPYSANGSIVICPRADVSGVYYQLTNINADTGEVTDSLTLPSAITPLEAGYGRNGFMFSFADIYDYEGAIANLGTYTPMTAPAEGNYDDLDWFDFARTPTAAPAWCGDLLIVKSSYSVCGVDLKAKTYFAIDVEDGSDTYGEYLASSGTHDAFVTYTNVDHTPIGGEKIHACRVKVWTTA